MKILLTAQKFATYYHRNQVRKYTGEPYIVHPAAVAAIVSNVTGDVSVLCTAWLHDTIEDTEATFEIVRDTFGTKIANMVNMLTDVSTIADGNRAVRKALDCSHTAKASPDAQTVKLADLIHNTSSIVQYDPKFAITYLQEKRSLLNVLQCGDSKLYNIALKLLLDGENKLSKMGLV